MTITPDFPIRGTTTITPGQMVAYAKSRGAKGEYEVFLPAMHADARARGINPLVPYGMWDVETDTGRSSRWTEHGDPAGLGVFADDTPTSVHGLTGPQSAAALIAELATKMERRPIPEVGGFDVRDFDPHFARVESFVERADWPPIETIADLNKKLRDSNDYTWAANPEHADAIVARITALLAFAAAHPDEENPTMPDPVFGRAPHPDYVDRPISKPEGNGQNDLGQRSVKGVVLHRILGTLWGTDSYFRGPVGALTDYGVGVASIDGAERDGQILRWNDPLGRQAGWASGPVSGAYGDGIAFVNKYGIDAVNRDQASIEISGNYDTPLTEAARDAIAGLIAYWADQAEIPWDVFPVTPGDGFSFVRWHQEFTLGTGKVCPGPEVMGETSALIERARQIMRAAQTGGKRSAPPPYATPELPAWWAESLAQLRPGDRSEGDVKYRVLRRNFRVKVQTTRRSKPDPRSAVSGPKLAVGELLFSERLVEANGKSFVLTNDGHYVLASKLSPKVKLTAW